MANHAVLIMMASYNGEKYIYQQIESILNQTYKNILLIIQDDKSTDNTIGIIEHFQKNDKRVVLWHNEERHGAYENFHSLINKCKKLKQFDYYMFSDHDDVWNEDKVEKLVKIFEKKNISGKPIMAYADMCIIDENNRMIQNSVNDIFNMEYKNKWSTMYNHVIYGCNSIMNKELFDLVPAVNTYDPICHILCHDNYYGKFAAFFGELIYVNKPLMKYRRYASNVTSSHDYSYGLKKIAKYIKSLDVLATAHARTYSQSIYTIKKMIQNGLNDKDYQVLNELVDSIKKGGLSGVLFAIKYKISCGRLSRTISRYFILFSKLHIKHLV